MKETFKITKSLCPVCRELIQAKIVFYNDKVYLEKSCSSHGNFKTLISSNKEAYKDSFYFKTNRKRPTVYEKCGENNCPLDCGLCQNHKQEPHIALIEITNRCNLNCPICIANSNSKEPYFINLERFNFMLDKYLEHKNTSKEIHFQGGEPTIHPNFFELLEAAQKKGIKKIRISTNGLIIADNKEFTKKLRDYDVIVHLQFDGFNDAIYEELRGNKLLGIKYKAMENLRECNIPTVLSPTLIRGVNDHEVTNIINFGLKFDNVMGVTFHLVAYTGRNVGTPPDDRLTMHDVIENILNNSGLIKENDVMKYNWQNSECFTSIYLVKKNGKINRANKRFNIKSFYNVLQGVNEGNAFLNLYKLTKNNKFGEVIKDFNILNNLKNEEGIFQIIIKPLMDLYNFDIERAKNCVVSVLTPEGNLIPYCAYNNLYRDMICIESIASKEQNKSKTG